MGTKLSIANFDNYIKELKKDYKIYAPVVMKGKGTFSDTDTVRYAEINSIKEVEFNKKANFSAKEVLLPITETLFYFTEDDYIEPKQEEKGALIFLRSCDIHGVKRIDEIYLRNGAEDPYYRAAREKVKFVLMGCKSSFENCFCVSMGSNTTGQYDLYVKLQGEEVLMDIKDNELSSSSIGEETEVTPDFVYENEVKVNIPESLDQRVMKSEMWKEYSARCIGCGKCNFVCPTCTCFTMQDIFYKDNPKNGERRRVWASCQVDGFTDMAGGHGFRQAKGERMRFKVMHKVYDYKKRFGYHMCVGCGRCDDACPEYISFSNCVNKLNNAMKEVEINE